MDIDDIFVGTKRLTTLKVKELQKELTKRALSTIGKKAELMERLAEALNEPAPAEEMEVDEVEEPAAEPKENGQEEPEKEEENLNERFITPDREMEAPDGSVRKSTTANRVRSAGRSALRPTAANPYLSEDDEDEIPLPQQPSSGRSSRPTANNLVTPAPKNEEAKSARRSCVSMRTRSRSPKEPAATPGNVLAGALTPSRPLPATRTPRSAAGLPRIPATTGAGSSKATTGTRSARRTLASAIGACSVKKVEVVGEKRATETPGKPPISAKRVAYANRFADLHKKMYEKEENIGERQERLKKRHEELTGNTPGVVQRLTTPTRSPARQRTPGVSPARVPLRPQQVAAPRLEIAEDLFKFGTVAPTDISMVQKKPAGPSSLAPGPSRAATDRTQRVDVKQRTKASGVRTATRTATEQLKNAGTPRQTPSRVGYTPKRGALTNFCDTTKLNDYELQLAREEGLIRGSAIKGAPPTTVNHKKRTQEILAIRRKLNIE